MLNIGDMPERHLTPRDETGGIKTERLEETAMQIWDQQITT